MQSLYDCKILDPACGSGAFPMGILQQMVHILNRIDPDNEQWKEMMLNNAVCETSEAYRSATDDERKEMVADIERSFDESVNRPDYARKLYLIENCIYGVDIQPIAIQISKLRFFISLVIDQKTNNKPEDNFGIRPLPNLEAKFVAANTLLSLNKSEVSLFDTETIKAKEQELKIAKHKIFSAKTVRTKRKYRDRVCELRQEIATLLEELGAVGNAEARQLAQWDMFDQNATSPFFDCEWMFGVSNGFDIVIGNPPYVQLQANGGALRKMYEHCGYSSFASTGDIYCLFYEKGYQMLKDGGHLCYITSNKWMRAGYGEKTREFFANKTNPILLIDFAGVKIFESATVDTNILLLSKSNNLHKTVCAITNKQNKDSVKNLSDFVQQQHSICSFTNEENWGILSPIEQSIKQKIESVGTPLKDWDIKIYRGVLTGYNDAFIISTDKREEILANCQTEDERLRTAELIRPILRGRDIKRYGYVDNGLYLINTHNGIRGRIPRVKIEDYPAIKAHLDQYWEKIFTRVDKGDTPYNLRNCAYLEDFFKPKIMYPNMTKYIPFYFDKNGFYQNDKSFMITGDTIAFLTAFLNSSIFKFCFLDNFPELQGGTRELRKIFFDKIPVLQVSKEINDAFIPKINDIQKDYTIQKAMEIDSMLFDLYNLTEEERKTIGFIEIT